MLKECCLYFVHLRSVINQNVASSLVGIHYNTTLSFLDIDECSM